MAVLIPNTTVTVRRVTPTEDSHGFSSGSDVTVYGPFQANVQSTGQAVATDQGTTATSTFAVYIDPSAWPVQPTDQLMDGRGRVFEVSSAVLVDDVPGGPSDLSHVYAEAAQVYQAGVV